MTIFWQLCTSLGKDELRPIGIGWHRHDLALLGMVSVFQENRVRIHVKFMFAWKTCKLFPTQTKGKHIIIIPSVCIQKRKPVWFFVFCENVFAEYKESNSFPFLCENRWNNCIMFSLCLHGKQSNCFPGKHKLYMFSTSVFLEYRDDPQQCSLIPIHSWYIRKFPVTISFSWWEYFPRGISLYISPTDDRLLTTPHHHVP